MRQYRRSLFSGSILIIALGLTLASGNDSASARASANQLQSTPFSRIWLDCVDCADCSINNVVGNKAFAGDSTSVSDMGGGTHTNCVTSGNCSQQHAINPDCPGFGGGIPPEPDQDAPTG